MPVSGQAGRASTSPIVDIFVQHMTDVYFAVQCYQFSLVPTIGLQILPCSTGILNESTKCTKCVNLISILSYAPLSNHNLGKDSAISLKYSVPK